VAIGGTVIWTLVAINEEIQQSQKIDKIKILPKEAKEFLTVTISCLSKLLFLSLFTQIITFIFFPTNLRWFYNLFTSL
jgi:hypothetical protein